MVIKCIWKQTAVALFCSVSAFYVLADGMAYSGSASSSDEPNEPNPCPGQCCAGNGGSGGSGSSTQGGGAGPVSSTSHPISLYNGEERLVYTDLVVQGQFPIVIQRRYGSHSDYDSPLGFGWSLNHDRRLYEYPDNSVVLRYRCGNRDTFEYSGGAYVTSNTGLRGTLKELSDGSFEFHYQNGTIDYFDYQGRLTKAKDVSGNTLEYTYSAERKALVGTSPYGVDTKVPQTTAMTYRLTSIAERLANGTLTGNSVAFEYSDSTGRLTKITSNDGRTITYKHDILSDEGGNKLTAGNLIEVNGLEGLNSYFAYEDSNDNHNITKIQIGDDKAAVVNRYDSKDRVTHQVYGTEVIDIDYTIDFYETKLTETVVDAEGQNPVKYTTVYRFNESGYTSEIEDALGGYRVYTHNSRNLISRIRYYGPLDERDDRELLKQENFTYNSDDQVLSYTTAIDESSTLTKTWEYKGAWVAKETTVDSSRPEEVFTTEYTFYYNSAGDITNVKTVKRLLEDGSYQTVTLTYNDQGNVLTTTYDTGDVLVNTYDDSGVHVTSTQWKDSEGNAIETGATRYTYNSLGLVASQTDANGNTIRYSYDSKSRLTTVTYPEVDGESYQVISTYDGNNLVTQKSGDQLLSYSYDNKERLISIAEQTSDGTNVTAQTYAYDSKGRMLSVTDGEGRSSSSTYDALGNRLTTTDAEGNTSEFTYDVLSRQIASKDPNGNTTTRTYDVLNRLVGTVQESVNPSIKTSLSYDALGNPLTVTDGNGNTTQYRYDLLGRLVKETRPLKQTLTYTYNNRNQLTEKTLSRGQRITYSYQPWGGLSSIDYYEREAQSSSRTVSFSYDSVGNQTGITDTAVQSTPLYSYSYDALNRLTGTKVHYLPGGDRSFAYGYDTNQNLNRQNFIDGGKTYGQRYTFDSQGLLTQAVLNNQTYQYIYNNAQQLVEQVTNSALSQANGYTDGGWLESITASSTTKTLESLKYNYEGWNIASRTDNDGSYAYSYDGANRLTAVTYPESTGFSAESFKYDAVSNRIEETGDTSHSYNANNQLTATNTDAVTFTYDDDGNMVSRAWKDGSQESINYSYNLENRLISVKQGSSSINYAYDPFGRRIKRTVNGVTTWFVWDAQSRMVAEINQTEETTALTQFYSYLPGAVVPTQVTDSQGSYQVVSDHLGTPKLLVDIDTEQVVWRAVSEAFGETTVNSDVDGDGVDVRFNIRFPGQYYDEVTGLHYNYYRDYDPSIGRYVQSDPIGLRGGLNTYGYVGGNPINYVDPFGLRCWTTQQGFTQCNGEGGWENNQTGYEDWSHNGENSAYSDTRFSDNGTMLACPSKPPVNDPNWKPYWGNPNVFHCGFDGYLENKHPQLDSPMNECFYDHSGNLVDYSHPYSGCGGSPDYFGEDNKWAHTFDDPGGICGKGISAGFESLNYWIWN